MSDKCDGLQEIINEALESMGAEAVGEFDPQGRNLADFCRRTGLSRQRARTIKSNGFKVKPHGQLWLKVATTVLRTTPGSWTTSSGRASQTPRWSSSGWWARATRAG